MLKTARFLSLRFSSCNSFRVQPLVRKYLTSAFNCEDAWNKRLQSPYVRKIKISDIYYELEHQFIHFGKANGIDIDLFANAVNDSFHLDEIEDVIHKLRLSPAATSLLPSTQHAFIRIMMSFGTIDELIRILDDRLNYGIFMDDYVCILLMNKSLKDNNFRDAAKIATIHMLQEDFSHPIVKHMALFACYKYLLNPVPWEAEQSQPEKPAEDEDEDEVVKLRVRYIRNPYFDDHFDLKKPSHLIGKTFWMIGNESSDVIGRSYSLIGYALHEKWDKLKDFLNVLLQSKEKPLVYKDSVMFVQKIMGDVSNEKSEDEKRDFELHKDDINSLLLKLENSDSLATDELLKVTEDKMKEIIKENETKTIENQIKVYEEWENQRRELVNEHIEQMKREKTLAEITAVKEEIKGKEKELFFFENEDKWDIMIESKKIPYPKKWLGKKKKKRVEDTEYVPPEIEKRRQN